MVGKDVANPTAMILTGVNMLNHMGYHYFGELISDALFNVFQEGKYLTTDLGGSSKASDFTGRIIDEIQALDNQ